MSPATPPPPISTLTASGLLVVYTLLYVAPFYLSPTTRPSPSLSRDAPSVIRARIRSVSLTCLLCSLATFTILSSHQASFADVLQAMGWWPVGLLDSARALLLTAVLFAGPLFETLVVDGAWRDCVRLLPLREVWSELTIWRNIVAGPLTEEILFRSAAVPLMLLARTPVATTVFLSPVIFGLAHIHHFYEFRLTHPSVSPAVGLLRSLFQLAYTSLFGAYATFLFLRTGSLLAIFAVHAFCNTMGLPRFWGRVEPDYVGPGGARPSVLWSWAYYALLVAGAVGWWKNLGALTESANALAHVAI